MAGLLWHLRGLAPVLIGGPASLCVVALIVIFAPSMAPLTPLIGGLIGAAIINLLWKA